MLGNLARFAGDGIRVVTDKAVCRYDKQKAVNWAIGPVPPEKLKEFPPFTGFTRLDFLKDQSSGGVEKHGLVGKPPVHVDGAAGSLEFVLKSRREADIGVTDGFCLAGAGFTNKEIPREFVDVLTGAAKFVDAGIETAPQFFQPGPPRRVVYAGGNGCGLLLDISDHRGRFPALHELDYKIERGKQCGKDEHSHGNDSREFCVNHGNDAKDAGASHYGHQSLEWGGNIIEGFHSALRLTTSR